MLSFSDFPLLLWLFLAMIIGSLIQKVLEAAKEKL